MIPIYHLEARILGRQNKSGERRSIVAKAAYRSGERLYDEHYERHWNFQNKRGGIGLSATARAAYRAGAELKHEVSGQSWNFLKKSGVAHSEISLPPGAKEWMGDRQKLWNAVDGAEKRKDAQLAREIIVALPSFFTPEQAKSLVREFAQKEFVARGMVADWSIHADHPHNLHAHIMLTMRDVASEGHVLAANATNEIKHAFKYGFLKKNTTWNTKEALRSWRKGWADLTNEHMAEAGFACRIDHRSFKDQGLELIPGITIGVGKERRQDPNLPEFLKERIRKQEAIQAKNGEQIIQDPTVALKAMARISASFSATDIADFLRSHTTGKQQFAQAYVAVLDSPALVRLNEHNTQARYTTRELLATEHTLGVQMPRDRSDPIQQVQWQKRATGLFLDGNIETALGLYENRGRLVQTVTRDQAKATIVGQWVQDGKLHPQQSRLMVAFSNEDVFDLNHTAHQLRKQRNELGTRHMIDTNFGTREFAVGERIQFRREDNKLGVESGSLGTVENIQDGIFTVGLDTPDKKQRQILVDTGSYKDLTWGYAATLPRAEQSGADRVYALFSSQPDFDRGAALAAMSAHKQDAFLYYAAQDFGADEDLELDVRKTSERLLAHLERDVVRERTHDYLSEEQHRQRIEEPGTKRPAWMDEIHAMLDSWEEKQPESERRFQEEIERLEEANRLALEEDQDFHTDPEWSSATERFEAALKRGREAAREQMRIQQEKLEEALRLELEKDEQARLEKERQRDYDNDYGM